MTRRLRNENGQAMVMTTVFLTVLIGLVAFAVDVGSWYRESRQAQSTADAAALAAAQVLPAASTVQAQALATQYANDNGANLDPANGIAFRSDYTPNDTAVVRVTRTAPGFFSKIFGIDSTVVRAKAAARSGVPIEVMGAAPIVVNKAQPELSGPGCPCFGPTHELKNFGLSKILGMPGGFGLINLDATGANHGASDVRNWLANGYDAYLGLGNYNQETGAKFASASDALNARVGTNMLFPVYDTYGGPGQNGQYHIVGWVAFYLDSWQSNKGNNVSLNGWFTSVIWNGIQSNTNPNIPDFGVHSIALVN